ncbi:MAG: drug/metabolite transporter (DMT)-like permease [Cellvibrionaceae bacterium]|jgi:drug/metabolite transporter (DMT)-like permease
MILSALGFALMGACVKLVSTRGIPVLEIVAARALISAVISYVDVKRKGISLWGNRKDLLCARGIAGALALVCVYYALVHIPFAEATMLQYLHPMFTAILALFFLRERLHGSTLLCIIFSFLGLIIIVRPSFLFGDLQASYSLLSVVAAIAGAFGSAVAYVLVRKLNETEDSSVIIFYFPIVALPFSLILLGDNLVMPQGWEWSLLLGVGIGTQVGQVGLTKAMQTETASKATSFSYLQVVFAAILGWLIFSEVPVFFTWLGGGFIILGAFINVVFREKSR